MNELSKNYDEEFAREGEKIMPKSVDEIGKKKEGV